MNTAYISKTFESVFASFKSTPEKFFSEFFKLSMGSLVFQNIPKQISMLLFSELATLCLEYIMNGKKSTSAVETSCIFTDKDIHCLEYFSGYCSGEMYRKLRKSRSSQSEVCSQWLSILLAAKTKNDQKLVDVKNRGGMWKVNENAVNIFKHCEQEYRKWTAECGHQIHSKLITKHIIENSIIRVNFASITDTSDQKIDREIAKNLLSRLVSLYSCSYILVCKKH